MITLSGYKEYLSNRGSHIGEIHKNESDMIMDATFTRDVAYRKVYILSKEDGWQYVDAKFSKHAIPSTSKDAVDSYLQFRPKVHYPVGSYVFIPDDISYELNIDDDNPLNDNADNLWLIVGRNDSKQFVRYLVLQCNWVFRWVTGYGDSRKLNKCWGCVRNANSYTSGIWNDFYASSLDSLSGAWLPNTNYVYGNMCSEFGLDDTRTLYIQKRLMMTVNDIHPNCYMISKVLDMVPKGILKLSMKLDDFNPKRDNIELKVCDYYDDSGDVVVTKPDSEPPVGTSAITYMIINNDGELESGGTPPQLVVGTTYYFTGELLNADSSINDSSIHWRITLKDDSEEYTDSERLALEKLMVIREVNSSTISLRPGKSNKIKGLTFILTACDVSGNYESTLEVEVES